MEKTVMTNAIKMMRLDFQMLTGIRSTIAVYVGIILVNALANQNHMIVMLVGMVFCVNTWMLVHRMTEVYHLERLYGELPVERKDIVNGHYASAGVISVIGVVMITAMLFLHAVLRGSRGGAHPAIDVWTGLMMAALTISVNIPLVLHFSYTKYSLFILIFSAGSAAIPLGAVFLATGTISPGHISGRLAIVMGIGLLLGAVLIRASIGCSQRIFQKKEL